MSMWKECVQALAMLAWVRRRVVVVCVWCRVVSCGAVWWCRVVSSGDVWCRVMPCGVRSGAERCGAMRRGVESGRGEASRAKGAAKLRVDGDSRGEGARDAGSRRPTKKTRHRRATRCRGRRWQEAGEGRSRSQARQEEGWVRGREGGEGGGREAD